MGCTGHGSLSEKGMDNLYPWYFDQSRKVHRLHRSCSDMRFFASSLAVEFNVSERKLFRRTLPLKGIAETSRQVRDNVNGLKQV